ncbi:MAG TPA: hypothetical protein PK445_10095 [Methanolinea sp.]|nr:hypothetical protein [Methanolinea sp.]
MALPQIPIGLEYIIAVPTILILIIIILVWYLLDLRRFGYEGFVFRKCRKKDLPCVRRTDIGTGMVEVIVGEKDEKGSPLFKDPKNDGHLIDPAQLHNTQPENWGGGLYMFSYATSQLTPLSAVNVLGFMKCREIGRKFPELSFLNDRDLMAFCKMKRGHLVHNARVMINRENPKWETGEPLTVEEFVRAVLAFQDECKRQAIDVNVPTAYNAAHAMNPVTFMVNDLEQVVADLERLLRAEFQRYFDIMKWAFAFVMVIGAVGVVVFILMQSK